MKKDERKAGTITTASVKGPETKKEVGATETTGKLEGNQTVTGTGRGFLGRGVDKLVVAEVADKLINSGFATLKKTTK